MAAVGEMDMDLKPLIGTDEATIDNKGRILLGKKKRDRLGDTFAMAIGELGCICAYPEARWQERLNEINRYDPINQGRQQYARLFFGYADDEMSCDAQGRVVIPGKLRDLGKLNEKVLLVGCYDHLEIWDPEEYDQYCQYPDTYGKERREAMERAYNKMKG
jgi:MraZ protein